MPDLVSDGCNAGAEVPFSGPAPIIILPSCPYVAVTLTHGSFSHQREADPFHIAKKSNFSSSSFYICYYFTRDTTVKDFLVICDQLHCDKHLNTVSKIMMSIK